MLRLWQIAAAALIISISTAAADSIDTIATDTFVPHRPLGWVLFCREHHDWCYGQAQTRPMPLTPALMMTLARINAEVNHEIVYRPDVLDLIPVNRPDRTILVERWTVEPKYGDCDDYAVTKLARLMRAGLPRPALRLAVYRLPSQQYHAVLTVETTEGTLVLSNLTDRVMPWREVPDAGWVILERVNRRGIIGFWELRG